jgi:hypothetical protein
MKRILAMLLAAAFGLPAIAQEKPIPATPIVPVGQKPTPPKPSEQKDDATPSEKLAKAKKEFDAAQRAYTTKRLEAVELAKEIFEADPKADVALEAFELLSRTGGLIGADATKIYAKVAEYHFANPKILPVLPQLARLTNGEALLTKIMEKNTSKPVQAQACLMLADAAAALVDREKDAKKSEVLADKAVALYERAKADFGDVQYRGDTVANTAEGSMFSLKYLRPGKPVPEIEGTDMDGKTFKISDYKGKVVMLDFWGHW